MSNFINFLSSNFIDLIGIVIGLATLLVYRKQKQKIVRNAQQPGDASSLFQFQNDPAIQAILADQTLSLEEKKAKTLSHAYQIMGLEEPDTKKYSIKFQAVGAFGLFASLAAIFAHAYTSSSIVFAIFLFFLAVMDVGFLYQGWVVKYFELNPYWTSSTKDTGGRAMFTATIWVISLDIFLVYLWFL